MKRLPFLARVVLLATVVTLALVLAGCAQVSRLVTARVEIAAGTNKVSVVQPKDTTIDRLVFDPSRGALTLEGYASAGTPVKDFDPWLLCLDDEPRVAELLCAKEPGWGDRLGIESLEAVVGTWERLNRDFFERWLGRRTARKEWLAPLLARNAAVVGSLPTGSPNSPSTPA